MPNGSDAMPNSGEPVPDHRHPVSHRGKSNTLPGGDDAMSGGRHAMPLWSGKRDGNIVPAGANAMPRQRWLPDDVPAGCDTVRRNADRVPGRSDQLPDCGKRNAVPDRNHAVSHRGKLLSAAC